MDTPTRTLGARRARKLFASAALLFVAAFMCAPPHAPAHSSQKERSGGQSTAAPVASTPSEVVRAYYTALQEARVLDAMMMSILRPAVEALSAAELQEFQADFAQVAPQAPKDYEITGEQVSGEEATIFVRTGEGKNLKVEPVYLIRERGLWLIGERADYALVKKQGKKFFFEQRIAVHEQDAEDMLKRIHAAQIAYALQNAGAFGDLNTLVRAGYVPQDILGTETTGYSFSVTVGAPGKGYVARAEPARYGRTGRLSFYMDQSGIQKKDTGGKPYSAPATKK
jgi:hypothetical protein